MTDQFSHTPGPWNIDDELPSNARSVIARVGTGDGPNIPISGNTVGPHDPAQNEPNARLIAAAPKLLEACEDYNKLADMIREKRCTPEEAYQYVMDIDHERGRPAIAKARGTDQ